MMGAFDSFVFQYCRLYSFLHFPTEDDVKSLMTLLIDDILPDIECFQFFVVFFKRNDFEQSVVQS